MRKGQTAMEYLMTYGWAILIIIVVVAALYAMGVFSMRGGVVCSPCFTGDLTFIDYSQGTADDGELLLRIGPKSVDVGAGTVMTCDAGCAAGYTITCVGGNEPCEPGDDLTIDSIQSTAGDLTVTITYTIHDGLTHSQSAILHNT